MALKTFKPITPGLRQLVIVDRRELYKGKPVKALTEGKIGTGGRNNLGRVTVRFRGGGHKQTYRYVDFKRRGHPGEAATVDRIEYDPNRTAFIALIRYADGELSYILAPQRLAVGDSVVAGDQVDIKPGNAMPIGNMPVGTIVHNVELKVGKGGALARSAGTYAQIVARDQGYVTLRLNSGEQRQVHLGRAPPGNPVGEADQGREDPLEQADRQIHRVEPARPQEEVEAQAWHVRSGRDRSSTATFSRRQRPRAAPAATR
jgi:large subunit ribosomal protein L2